MTQKRIPAERANDTVQTALRQSILASELKPGQQLNVNELAAQYRVSLTPVRNAIQLLAAEGLVEVRPRSGTFVALISADEVRETFEIRRALECLAVEKAATRGLGSDERARLEELLVALDLPVETPEDRRRHELDNAAFHQLLIGAGQNSKLASGYAALNANIQIARIHAGDTKWPERLEKERVEHRAIVDALMAGDSPRAVAALREHVDRACRSLMQALESRRPAATLNEDVHQSPGRREEPLPVAARAQPR